MAKRKELPIIIKLYDQFSKKLRGLFGILNKLKNAFFNLKTAILGAVGVGGLGLLISNSLKATDALAKTASRIGTTTEALSKLQYAGQLAGIETNTMNMAMQRFVRRTAEATRGTGEAVGAFRSLKINAQEIQALPLDERMRTLAKSFKNLKSEEEKLAVAFKLFDSEGTAVLNMLKQTDAEMSAVFDEAKKLGLVISTETAAGVEKANDAFTRLQALFNGTVRQIVAALAPALETLFTKIKNVKLELIDSNGGIEKFSESIAKQFLGAVKQLILGLEQVHLALFPLLHEMKASVFDFRQFFGLNGLSDAEEEIRGRMLKISTALKAIDQMGEKRANRAVATLNSLGFPTVDEAKKELDRLMREQERVMATFTRPVRPEPPDYSGWIAAIDSLVNAVDDPIRRAASAFSEIESFVPAPTAFQNFINNLNRTRQEAGDLTPSLQKLGEQAITGLGDAFTGAITGAKNFADAMRAMSKSVIDSLIKLLVQKYIVDAAFGAITNMISPTGANGAPILTGPTGIEFGPAQNYVGKARGGPVTGGRPYVVGEKGPELMIPSGNGSIVPNNQLGGGGITVVQNINVTTGVQQTVRAEIANLLPQISNAAKSAVADARMRGGGFSKAMVGA